MFKMFTNFLRDEDGAVTVDWVILTAAIVGFGAFTVVTLRSESDGVTERTATYMERQDPTAYTDLQNVAGPAVPEEGEAGAE